MNISSLKKNLLYNTLYQILTIAIPLVTTPYVSRVLGAEGLGRYSYAFSIVTYFMMFAMLGVNNYGNRSVAMVRDDANKLSKTFCSIYVFQLITSLIMIVIYVLYVITLYDDKCMGWIMLVYLFASAIDINWVFFGLEQFKITVIRNTVIKLLSVFAIFAFVKDTKDVYVYSLIYMIGSLLSQIYLWTIVKRYVKFSRVSFIDIVPHIKPNLILFIPVIAVSLYKVMDKIMLGSISTKSEVGFYEACEKVIAVPMGLVSSLGTVMMPRMSNLLANNEVERSKQYISKSILIAVFLSTSISFGIMAVAKEFVPIFYGEGYEKCISLFQLLLPSGIFIAFANVIRTQYLIPNQKDRVYVISVIMGAIINLIINIILIPRYASIGAAIGTLCAEAAVCAYQCYTVRKELNMKSYIVNSIPYLLAGILMYIVLINLTFSINSYLFILMLKVCIGCIVYVLLFLILNKLLKLFRRAVCIERG